MVFLNGDDKFLAPYRGKLSHKTFFYGMDKACDYRAENVHVKDGQTIFISSIKKESSKRYGSCSRNNGRT